MHFKRFFRDFSPGKPRYLTILLALLAVLMTSSGCSERRKEAARLEAELVAARSRGVQETPETKSQTENTSQVGQSAGAVPDESGMSADQQEENASDSDSTSILTDSVTESGLSTESAFASEALNQILSDSAKSQPVVSQRPKDGYTVQIAGTPSADEAAAIVDRFKLYGYDAYTAEVSRDGRPFYRVRIGRFETEQEALQLKAQLAEQQQVEGWVDQGTWQ